MRIKQVIMTVGTFTIVAQEIRERVKIGDCYRIPESSVIEVTSKEYLKFVVRQIEVSDDCTGLTVTLTGQNFLQTRMNQMEDLDIRKFIGKTLERNVEENVNN